MNIKDLPPGSEVEFGSGSVSLNGNFTAHIVDESEVTIAVMGATGSGKTTFINMASGSNLRIGRGLQSCTSIVQIARPFDMAGRRVTLIDTPGFDDTNKSDADILRMIAAFLATAYENGKKLAGVIYIHRISDFRMGGISTRNFKMFRELCGETSLKNVVIVTNMWGEVSKQVGEAREAELISQDMFFKPVLDKGAKIERHENTRESAHRILEYLISNHPLSLRIQRELVDEGKDISQTAAGAELNREMMAQLERHRKEMRILQEEMKEAVRTRDEESRKELEVESKKLETELRRVQADSQKLATDYNEEKGRLERRLQELSESAKRDAERAAAEYQKHTQDLQSRLAESVSISATEKADIMRQLADLQRQHVQRGGGGVFGMIGRAIDGIFGF
ncbi:GTP-binding protein A [Hypsizygus marmoreus]|uniref:GTP-binding protein A n=1 Tax=Hypsizygus marmoreus TaxID=39966 RepID=A0A369K3M6_HYPMA|nr:GTP-binding protein A [Hypsizygus marmoreus]